MANVIAFGVACSFLLLQGCSSLDAKQYRIVNLALESPLHEQILVELKLERLLNETEQARGLMFVAKLAENEGVLLEYPKEARRGIWMKNMLIPIDAIFVNEKGHVVAMFSEIEPCPLTEKCPIYAAEKTQYIIETAAGFIKTHGLQTKHTRIVFD
ncbi:MAG: DUF192 domain-containing protein [Thiotrichales bacterium]|nr:DUF192 domain-containing protein [Thiotrichales bacterium]